MAEVNRKVDQGEILFKEACQIKKQLETDYLLAEAELVKKMLKKYGYDGIMYENHFEDEFDGIDTVEFSYLVLEPYQVKSVFNKGSYRLDCPDILE